MDPPHFFSFPLQALQHADGVFRAIFQRLMFFDIQHFQRFDLLRSSGTIAGITSSLPKKDLSGSCKFDRTVSQEH
jgi:hypothetical protein